MPGGNPDGSPLLGNAGQVGFGDPSKSALKEEPAVEPAQPVKGIYKEVVDAAQQEADRDHDVEDDKDSVDHSDLFSRLTWRCGTSGPYIRVRTGWKGIRLSPRRALTIRSAACPSP